MPQKWQRNSVLSMWLEGTTQNPSQGNRTCGKGFSGATVRDIGYQLDSQWDISHPTFNLSLIVLWLEGMAANLRDPGSIPGGDPKRFQVSSNYVFYIVGECFSSAADTHLATDLTCKVQLP